MNNKKLLPVAILILLLIAGAATYLAKPKQTNSSEKAETNKMEGSKQDMLSDIKGSFLDLMKAGNAVKCTYSSNDENMKVSGTTYVADKKMRTESKVVLADGKQMDSQMISDGDWLYTWTSDSKQGMKIKIDSVTKSDMENKDGTKQIDPKMPTREEMKDLQGNYDFKCSKWNADSSMFVLPKDVTFSDLSQLMQPTTGGSGVSAACGACEYAPTDEAKASCKKQLNCQ